MDYLIKDEKLELKYEPGKGAWTYHIQIPNTKHIRGKWGSLKVSGSIDGYRLESKNLFTITGKDKLLSVNETIRKAINKSGGDIVTLYLLKKTEQITENQILETFKELGVSKEFSKIHKSERDEILKTILAQNTEEKQLKIIGQQVDRLAR